MRWGQALIFFVIGAFFGPWLLSMFTGRKSSSPAY